jgi:hypothetical protein
MFRYADMRKLVDLHVEICGECIARALSHAVLHNFQGANKYLNILSP